MQKPILIAAFAIALLAAAWAIGLFDPAPTPVDPSATNPTETSVPTATAEASGVETAPIAVPATERTAVGAADERPIDPAIQRALCGFRGRVLTAKREPVADKLVRILRFAPDSIFPAGVTVFAEDKVIEPDVEGGEARTDVDGRFTVTGVWPRAFYLLQAAVDGEVTGHRIIDSIPGPGEIVDLGDIVLEDCGVLVGRVVDRDGLPIADALVRAVDLPGSALSFLPFERLDPEAGVIVQEPRQMVVEFPAWTKRHWDRLPIPATRSAADGRFRLTGVVPGSNFVAITAKEHTSHVNPRVLVDPGEEKNLGDLRLTEGEIAYVKVERTDGSPVAGAEIMIAPKSSIGPVHFAVRTGPTDAAGEFECAGFPSGDVLVAVRVRRGEPWMVTGPEPVAADHIVTLAAEHSLTLELVSEIGAEIQAPRLQITPAPDDQGGVEMAMWGVAPPLDLKRRLSRLEDGRFRITDLPTGKYAVLAQAAGHAASVIHVDVQANVEHTLRLGAHRTFDVLVVDASGEPVRNASVFAEATGNPPHLPEFPVHCGYTGRDGELHVDTVHASKVRISATHPAFGAVHGEAELPPPGPIRLAFEAPGAIAGTLTDNGRVPDLGKWTIVVDRRRDGPRGAHPDMPRLVVADAEGGFSVTGLRPGSYRLQALHSLRALRSPGGVLGLMQTAFLASNLGRTEVTVTAGQVASCTLEAQPDNDVTGPSANVSGSVVVDGRVAEGFYVIAHGERRAVSQVDRTGRFDLGRMPVGHLSIQVNATEGDSLFPGQGNQVWGRNLQIEENADLDLTIEITTSGVSGTVWSGGLPAANVQVMLQGQIAGDSEDSAHIWRHTMTTADGTFSFAQTPVGVYEVTASHDELGKVVLKDVRPGPGAPVSGLRLELAPVYRVRGHLDTSIFGDDRPEWMWIYLEAGDSDMNSWSQVAGDGSFEFEGVLPGTYTIGINASRRNRSRGNDVELAVPGEITVTSGNLEGVRLEVVERPPEQPDEGRRR